MVAWKHSDKRQSRMAIIITIAVNVNKTSRNFMVPEEALLLIRHYEILQRPIVDSDKTLC